MAIAFLPKSHLDTEIESIVDIRKSLAFLCESFDEIKQQNASTDRRISELMAVVKEKDAEIDKLESQVNDTLASPFAIL